MGYKIIVIASDRMIMINNNYYYYAQFPHDYHYYSTGKFIYSRIVW